jgi:hypothetical protein
MTDTEPASRESASLASLDPGLAEGRSRLLLFVGLGALGVGHLVDASLAVWSGVAVVAAAFALNTAGKLTHYRTLPIPGAHRAALAASWLLLAACVVALLANYAAARFGGGDGGYFWALAVAGFGFGLLHVAAQSTYLPASEVSEE